MTLRAARRVLAVCAGAVLLGRGTDSARGQTLLHPYSVRSPSSAYELTVDPSRRDGAGSATYRLTRDGREVWAGQRPLTLWRAAVADDGTVAGFAYTHGYCGRLPVEERPRRDAEFGEFVVVILAPDGAVRCEDRVRRGPPKYVSTPPGPSEPCAEGCFLDPEGDRFVVRLRFVAPDRRGTEWWIYRLSTGQRSGQISVRPPATSAGMLGFERDARPVRGTPLALVHWLTDNGSAGALFGLVDLRSGALVWSDELPGDYVRDPLDGNADVMPPRHELAERVAQHRAIMDPGEPAQFAIWHVRAGRRVTYAVRSKAEGEWEVTEVDREPFGAPLLAGWAPPKPERRVLGLRGVIRLIEDEAPHDAAPPARAKRLERPCAWTVDGRGRLYFVDAETHAVHVFDSTGRRLRILEPRPTDIAEPERGAARPPAGGALLAVAHDGTVYLSWPGVGRHPEADRRGVNKHDIRALAFAPDGGRIGFLAARGPAATGYWLFQPNEPLRWVVGPEQILLMRGDEPPLRTIERQPDGAWLSEVGAAGVAPDGGLAAVALVVRDGIAEGTLNLYGPRGEPVRTIRRPDCYGVLSLAHGGRWVALVTARGVLLVDVARGSLTAVALEGLEEGAATGDVQLARSPSGDELWVWRPGTREVRRYAVPYDATSAGAE